MAHDLSAFAMALLWLIYGRGHFTHRDEVLREVPRFIPGKEFIVSATGVAEITLAVLLLPAATRLYAAWGTIVLLVLYVPAIVHMVANDVFPEKWSPWLRTTIRLIAIPHNVLLGLLAYWLTMER